MAEAVQNRQLEEMALKKFLITLVTMVAMFAISGNETSEASKNDNQSKILVAYFSRTGEEYGVGTVTKGNTKIIAEIIAKQINADLFEIRPIKEYPYSYEECKKVASREKAMKSRPAISTSVENFQQYDVIFVGYPIWYGDAPMVVYTFLESYDFSGKKIIPFCTHGGSGLSSTDQNITLTCPNSTIMQGFEIRGTTARDNIKQAEIKVIDWLKKINIIQ